MSNSFRRTLMAALPLILLLHTLSPAFFVHSHATTGLSPLNVILKDTLQNASSLASRATGVVSGGSSTLESDVNDVITDAVEPVANTQGVHDVAVLDNSIADILASNPFASLFYDITPDGINQVLDVINGNTVLTKIANLLSGVNPNSVAPINVTQLVEGFTRAASTFGGANWSVTGVINGNVTMNLDFLSFLKTFGNAAAAQAGDNVEPLNHAENVSSDTLGSIRSVVDDAATSVADAVDGIAKSTAVSYEALQSVENALTDFLSNVSSLDSSQNVGDAQLIQNLTSVQATASDTMPEAADSNFLEAVSKLSAFDNLDPLEANSMVAELGMLISPGVFAAVDVAGVSDLIDEYGSINVENVSKVLQRINETARETSAIPDHIPGNVLQQAQDAFGSLLARVTGDSYQAEKFTLDKFFNANGTINTEFVHTVASDILSVREANNHPVDTYAAVANQTSNPRFENFIDDIRSLTKEKIDAAENGQAPELNAFMDSIAAISTHSIVPRGIIDIAGSLLGEGGLLADADISTFVTDSGAISVVSVTQALAGVDSGNTKQFLEVLGLASEDNVTVGEAVKLLAENMYIDENGTVTVNGKPLGVLGDEEDTLLLTPVDAEAIVGASAATGEYDASVGSALSNLVDRSDGELTETVQNVENANNNLISNVGNALRSSNTISGGNMLGNAANMRGALGNAVGSIVGNRRSDNSPMGNVAKAINDVVARNNDPLQGVAENVLGNRSPMRNVAKAMSNFGNGSLQNVAGNVVGNGSLQGVVGNVLGNGTLSGMVNSGPLSADGRLSTLGNVAENLRVDNASELLDLANNLNVSRTSTLDDVLHAINGTSRSIIERMRKATGFRTDDNPLLRGSGYLIDQGELASAFLSSFNRIILQASGIESEFPMTQ